MKAINFFGREYTGANQLAEKTASALGCRVIYDRDIIDKAVVTYNLKSLDIEKSIYNDSPCPERFSSGKARCIAAVKSVLAEEIKAGSAIFSGFLGELIPREIGLHVLVTSGEDYRLQQIFRKEGSSGEKAAAQIQLKDREFFQWSHYLKESEILSHADCDAVVASDQMEDSEIIEEISRAIKERNTEADIKDFALSAKVASVMAQKGYPVAVSAHGSRVDMTILKPVLMLSRHEKKLADIALSVHGVLMVHTYTGPGFYRPNICSRYEFALSSKAIFSSIEKQYDSMYRQVSGKSLSFINKRQEIHLSSRV